jgi:ferric iron reductase protein FhuF
MRCSELLANITNNKKKISWNNIFIYSEYFLAIIRRRLPVAPATVG